MKIAILVLFIALTLVTAIDAKSITEELKIGDSVILKNQNITLLNLNTKEDKVILCINGIKTIVTENSAKTVNGVKIDVERVKTDFSRIKFESGCNNCKINDNNACLNECTSNSNCDDNNEKTVDVCKGTPLKCVYEEIIETTPTIKEEITEMDVILKIKTEPKITPLKSFFAKLKDLFYNIFFE